MRLMNEKGAIYTPQGLIFSPTEEDIAALPPAIQKKAAPVYAGTDISKKLSSRLERHKIVNWIKKMRRIEL